MELCIVKTCLHLGVESDILISKHSPQNIRIPRIMLWLHLVRDRGFSYGKIAKRFQCSRRNVIWSVRELEGNMLFHKGMRNQYRDFKNQAGLTEKPTPLVF